MEEDFVKVAETKDVQASQMMAVEVNGEKVCIANAEGRYYAIGFYVDYVIVCTTVLSYIILGLNYASFSLSVRAQEVGL